jgi:hypothetical protein
MISAKSGKELHFFLAKEIRDQRENEIVGWRFEIAEESVRQIPMMKGAAVEIFND